MGISAGWADVYTADIACQYLVIDDIPDGDYVLVAITNAARKVPEDTFDDNTVTRGLHIEGSTVVEIAVPTGFVYTASTSVQPTREAVAASASVSTGAVPTLQTSAGARLGFTHEFAMASLFVLTLTLWLNAWI